MIAALTAIRLWAKTNPRAALGIFVLVLAILVLGGSYLKGRHDAEKREAARDAIAQTEALNATRRADIAASRAAQHDALNRMHAEKELADAVADVVDTVPDAVAVRAGCCELQQNGRSIADLPACRDARGQTPACTQH